MSPARFAVGIWIKWWPLVLAGVVIAVLQGCSAPIPVPETVQVPVPIPCIEQPIARPNFATDAELAAMDDYKATINLWLDRRVRQIYESRLEAAQAGCWQPAKGGV